MSWNGHPVIDLDAHIVERADRFYRDYLDPAYHDARGSAASRLRALGADEPPDDVA